MQRQELLNTYLSLSSPPSRLDVRYDPVTDCVSIKYDDQLWEAYLRRVGKDEKVTELAKKDATSFVERLKSTLDKMPGDALLRGREKSGENNPGEFVRKYPGGRVLPFRGYLASAWFRERLADPALFAKEAKEKEQSRKTARVERKAEKVLERRDTQRIQSRSRGGVVDEKESSSEAASSQDDQHYEISRVSQHRLKNGVDQYLCHWKPKGDQSWEPSWMDQANVSANAIWHYMRSEGCPEPASHLSDGSEEDISATAPDQAVVPAPQRPLATQRPIQTGIRSRTTVHPLTKAQQRLAKGDNSSDEDYVEPRR